MINKSNFPEEMRAYFGYRWPQNLWELGQGPVTAKISTFLWQLDCPFWASSPPEKRFDLTPRAVISTPESFAGHWKRIMAAETNYPVTVAFFENLPVILDGIHRLAKLYLEKKDFIQYMEVPRGKLIPVI